MVCVSLPDVMMPMVPVVALGRLDAP